VKERYKNLISQKVMSGCDSWALRKTEEFNMFERNALRKIL
jgi:hypothetical protein